MFHIFSDLEGLRIAIEMERRGESFYRQLAGEADITKTMAQFLARGREETLPDQWQSQILVRILATAAVIYISDAPKDMIRAFHMIPADTIGEAMEMAKSILKKDAPTVTAIPDGIAVMVADA